MVFVDEIAESVTWGGPLYRDLLPAEKDKVMKKFSIQRWKLQAAPGRRLELHLYQTMNVLKSRLQLVLGLVAAGLILVTALQTADFTALKEKMMVLKSLFK